MNRRNFVAGSIAGVAGLGSSGPAAGAAARANELFSPKAPAMKSRLKLSVSRWSWGKLTLDQLCQTARGLGMDAIDLLEPDDWNVPLRYGLVCAMGYATVPH